MRKVAVLFLSVFLTGCATVIVPSYIKDQNPYKQKYYSDFETVLNATTDTIEEFGWVISGTSDPAVYERSKSTRDPNINQILLFTEIQEVPFFLGTRYATINAYIRTSSDNTVEVEIRYLKVTSVPMKSFYDYEQTKEVDKMLARIEERLN